MEHDLDICAQRVGKQIKLAYSLRDIAELTGIPYSTLASAVREGRLRSFLPPGRKRGFLVKPQWFDDWWSDGTN